jgi:hypothetical protein
MRPKFSIAAFALTVGPLLMTQGGCADNSTSLACNAYLGCLGDIVAIGGPASAPYQGTLAAAQAQFGSSGGCGHSASTRAVCDNACVQGLSNAHASYPQLSSCTPLPTALGPGQPPATADNVSSCKSFLQQVACGATSLAGQFNCQTYAAQTCDLSPYFDCLSNHYVCTNGSYDPVKLAGASECASKAVCTTSTGQDMSSWDGSSPPVDLSPASTGCNGFTVCYLNCMNAPGATLAGCENQCGAQAKAGVVSRFETALTCGQDHCVGPVDAGTGKCRISGGTLVNQDGSMIMSTDPGTGLKACAACLNDALARLFNVACTGLSSVDCNPVECVGVTNACLNDLP